MSLFEAIIAGLHKTNNEVNHLYKEILLYKNLKSTVAKYNQRKFLLCVLTEQELNHLIKTL